MHLRWHEVGGEKGCRVLFKNCSLSEAHFGRQAPCFVCCSALLLLKLVLGHQSHSHVDTGGPQIPHQLYSLRLEQLAEKVPEWYLGHCHLSEESDSKGRLNTVPLEADKMSQERTSLNLLLCFAPFL